MKTKQEIENIQELRRKGVYTELNNGWFGSVAFELTYLKDEYYATTCSKCTEFSMYKNLISIISIKSLKKLERIVLAKNKTLYFFLTKENGRYSKNQNIDEKTKKEIRKAKNKKNLLFNTGLSLFYTKNTDVHEQYFLVYFPYGVFDVPEFIFFKREDYAESFEIIEEFDDFDKSKVIETIEKTLRGLKWLQQKDMQK